MKYYGLKNKIKKERFLYFYAKKRAKFLSIIPGKEKAFWKRNYSLIYEDNFSYKRDNNSLPDNSFFDLYSIVIADLIRRENIKQLQKGIRLLLQKRRSNRFISLPIDGLDEICKKIEQMDESLLAWYNTVECGLFEFKNHPLNNSIDYFSAKICNVNSGYLSLVFNVHLHKEKKNELAKIIEDNYQERKGYAFQTLTSKRDTTGAYKNYSVAHYNDNALKADKIFEFISYIEWEFLQELSSFFPFVFHNKNISPPRIEIYSTNIDYHEDNRSFWNSIGINDYQGEFIDERHKIFYENNLSERYSKLYSSNRILYIFKDDGIEIGQFKSIKDVVHFHIKKYAIDYFKFMFLDMLSRETGKILVDYKHKLDKIKLKKNRLKSLLKLKYNLSVEIDDYNRYKRDDIWEKSQNRFNDIYDYSDRVAKLASRPFFISHTHFCDNAISESKKIDEDIDIILAEFEEKKMILQNLADYKNTRKSIWLNIIMALLTAMTLFLTAITVFLTAMTLFFPADKIVEIANLLSAIWNFIMSKL